MAEADLVPWPTCQRVLDPSCTGFRAAGYDECVAHLDESELDQFLIRSADDPLDLRGVSIDQQLLDRILRSRTHDGRIDNDIDFERARFIGAIAFSSIRFAGRVRFDAATFSGDTRFRNCDFDSDVEFTNTTFAGRAWFDDTRFGGGTWFRTEFCKDTEFVDVSFENEADFTDATFAGRVWFIVRARRLRLDGALFAQYVDVRAEAVSISCDGARFDGNATLRSRHATIRAERATFGSASSISRSDEPILALRGTIRPAWLSDVPNVALSSLRGTDVSNLVLTDVYLGACNFAGAHRLDELRFDGWCEFTRPPRWRGRRRILAEEGRWRGWPSDFQPYEPVPPERISATYRSLRKSFEDSKNAADAGDFYYGEMEMRRRAVRPWRVERMVLTAYWLFSGYGQRASRALVALLVLVLTVAGLLLLWGQPVGNAARVAVGAVVFRDDRTDLTEAGEWTVLVARFLGPVLLALAVLAVRARVKR